MRVFSSFMKSVPCDHGSAATADETKQRRSVSIREEDRAESVPIKDRGAEAEFQHSKTERNQSEAVRGQTEVKRRAR